MKDIIHVAIPSKNIEESKAFYHKGLACTLGREYADRISINFFGAQLVCHLSPNEIDPSPKMYPRHFGISFSDKTSFDKTLSIATENSLPFYKKPFIRFKDTPEEHHSFFLIDPSNNLIEFKFYPNADMRY